MTGVAPFTGAGQRCRAPRTPAGLRLAVLALLVLLGATARAARQEPVTVTLMPAGPSLYKVVVLFPPSTSPQVAAAALNSLVQRSGWTPGQSVITMVPRVKDFPAQIMASFTVNTAYPNGQFPVEALAVAFRSFGAVNVMFSHGGTFQYNGAPHYEDKDVAIDASTSPTSLTLTIHVKNPKLDRLSLFPPMSQSQAVENKHAPRGVPTIAWVIFAILGAALAWILVFALMSGGREKPARKPMKPGE